MTKKPKQLFHTGLISVKDLVDQKDQNPFEEGRAAVLVPLFIHKDQWHIVLTLRASNLRQHPGEVAFPGGMWEPGDTFPVDTALRESNEEIALPVDAVEILGGLAEAYTKRLTPVRPVVGVISHNVPLVANPDEIESIFTVPIDFFAKDQRTRTDIFGIMKPQNEPYWSPAYDYEGYEIWGFTSRVIVELMTQCFSMPLEREHEAPEKHW